ncbi:MAG: MBOAT family protein [Magnetococcales bacterium]|nr:MBOAT family protein [Magnetococcales bacterium]
MIFHSLDFLIFFVLVLTVYWRLERKWQNYFLLLVSYFFYGYVHFWFLYLIFASTLVDYFCGLAIARFPEKKKYVLWLSISVNLTFLGFFKYFGFFVDNVAALLVLLGLPSFTNHLDIFLPVGISFYTFQSMSYIIDVYAGRLKARENFFDFALFVVFFPQLVAGPIERAVHLLPQVEKERTLTWPEAREALFLLVWGFFKKLVIADNVAFIVNKLFILEHTTFYLAWVGVFAFGVQVYADFSAYTDIARGSARMLGFTLSQNFNHPFISASPAEYWKRWHISLSSYIQDYIFLPLFFSLRARGTRYSIVVSLLITFFLVGLWHGANWNFIIFGLYHGLLVILYGWCKNITPIGIRENRWLKPFQILLMFVLAHIGFMLFRETELSYILRLLSLSPFAATTELQQQSAWFLFGQAAFLSLPLWIHTFYDHVQERLFVRDSGVRIVLHTLVSLSLFLAILALRGDSTEFIYFQF